MGPEINQETRAAELAALRSDILQSEGRVKRYCLSQPYDPVDFLTEALSGSEQPLSFVDASGDLSFEQLVRGEAPSLVTGGMISEDGPILESIGSGGFLIVYNASSAELPIGSPLGELVAALEGGASSIDFSARLESTTSIPDSFKLIFILNGSGCC